MLDSGFGIVVGCNRLFEGIVCVFDIFEIIVSPPRRHPGEPVQYFSRVREVALLDIMFCLGAVEFPVLRDEFPVLWQEFPCSATMGIRSQSACLTGVVRRIWPGNSLDSVKFPVNFPVLGKWPGSNLQNEPKKVAPGVGMFALTS